MRTGIRARPGALAKSRHVEYASLHTIAGIRLMKYLVLVSMVSLFVVSNFTGCGGSSDPTVVEMDDTQIADYEARERLRQEQMENDE
ncbi:hypothetical protein Q31b_11980 [Novipirellula aureliae]|uniref:Uncharacterized protein n=2 Tax=Novipirellula aureliae TaxID=2527966 RepID=A0A5C6EBD5_9BACT|nr:hypothetical protein Q31b_11980 [Novipirellula aureliae]